MPTSHQAFEQQKNAKAAGITVVIDPHLSDDKNGLAWTDAMFTNAKSSRSAGNVRLQ